MSGTAGKTVICAGRLYCDLVFTDVPRLPTPGTEVFAGGLGLHAGGGAFITAATLASLGHGAGLLSVLPAVPFADGVRDALDRHGVDTALCTSAEVGADPQITVVMSGAGDRAFLSRAVGAACPVVSGIDGYDHLHIGELRTLIEQPFLLDAARRAGMTVSLDCGWSDEIPDEAHALIAQVDVFLPNEAELDALGGACDLAPLTVVKCGVKGARAKRSGKAWKTASVKPTKVVDATGAGDAFNGGFLSGWLAGLPLAACLDRGNMCGAAVVQEAGGTAGLALLEPHRPEAV